jgi:hypothetical protein
LKIISEIMRKEIVTKLSVIYMLNVIYAKCLKIGLYAECRYAKCLYVECRGAIYVTRWYHMSSRCF